jgi:hypothetical protein
MKAVHMASDCGDISFVLVKNDENIVQVSSVVNDIVCLKPVLDDQFLKILKIKFGCCAR